MTAPGGVWSATGHRPEKCGGYGPIPFAELVATARMAVTWAQPDKMLVGMALGWDTAVAVACFELRVPFVACIPFKGQELRWRYEQQDLYRRLLGHATEMIYVSEPPYAPEKMDVRNRYMVGNSEKVMALWNGDKSGGTANCVRYALPRKQVCNWWDLFRQIQRGEISIGPWESAMFPMEVPF